MYVFPTHAEFIESLHFAQSHDLDVREFHIYGYEFIVVYKVHDFFMLFVWLYNPERFDNVEHAIF